VTRANPRLGYGFALAAAAVSGASVFINSLGVHVYKDATLYTTLKNSVTGLALLVLLLFATRRINEYRRLDRRTWGWLVALAITGGSVPYVLFFNGLQHSNATTAAFLNHLQFVLVAIFAAAFLRERVRPALWAGFAVLLVGATLGLDLRQLRWTPGSLQILASTVLFAIDFVIARHLLKGLSTTAVMTAKMTLGSLILVAYSGLTGHLAAASRLSALQLEWVLATGLILLAFTACTFIAIKHARVSVVIAIGMIAPIITTLLQFLAGQHVKLSASDAAGIAATLTAAAFILAIGIQEEQKQRPAAVARPSPA
jgi:drug/metabolite transporter (DMT)-like permease